MKRALQRMPPFCHLTDTSKDMVKTVNSETLLHPNSHFTFSLADDSRNLHSDDGDKTSKKRAFERALTHPEAPIIGRKRAISVMAIDIDDHRKKRKILSECAPKCTPEEATLTAAELYARFFCTPPEHVTPFFNHHINAVIRNGTLVLSGTSPGKNSRRPPCTSASINTDENTIVHGDKHNCPAPAEGIGPMSERDPKTKMSLTSTSTTTFPTMASTLLTCQPLLLSTLSVLRIVEIVCICTHLKSHMHLILLTPQLQMEPKQNQ